MVANVVATALALGQWALLATVLAGAAQSRLTSVPFDALAGLVCLLAARAGAEVVAAGSGRLAATTVTSQLRLALVRHRLAQHHDRRVDRRDGRRDGDGDGQAAVQAVVSVAGLDLYASEYLPQRVLAVVAPMLVLALVSALDPPSALVLAATLPVVPVFMVVIGRSAAARSRANLAALDALAGHFLDVVRGMG
nr:hypothetical protein [Micromonospora sp. DSM 115978]